ncbi:MAG: transposase [Thermoplasmataceae archaeon]
MRGKFTVDQKYQAVMESFTSSNIAELSRRHGVSVAQLNRWKERFIESGKKGLGESAKGNEYEKQIDELKRLIGDQALVIEAFKKTLQGRKR